MSKSIISPADEIWSLIKETQENLKVASISHKEEGYERNPS